MVVVFVAGGVDWDVAAVDRAGVVGTAVDVLVDPVAVVIVVLVVVGVRLDVLIALVALVVVRAVVVAVRVLGATTLVGVVVVLLVVVTVVVGSLVGACPVGVSAPVVADVLGEVRSARAVVVAAPWGWAGGRALVDVVGSAVGGDWANAVTLLRADATASGFEVIDAFVGSGSELLAPPDAPLQDTATIPTIAIANAATTRRPTTLPPCRSFPRSRRAERFRPTVPAFLRL